MAPVAGAVADTNSRDYMRAEVNTVTFHFVLFMKREAYRVLTCNECIAYLLRLHNPQDYIR